MKALFITPQSQSIELVDVNSQDDIKDLIGFDTIISDEIGSDGDCLFFDEDCFLRSTEGRFQIDTLVPVAGNALIVGSKGDGATLSDVNLDIDELKRRIKYL